MRVWIIASRPRFKMCEVDAINRVPTDACSDYRVQATVQDVPRWTRSIASLHASRPRFKVCEVDAINRVPTDACSDLIIKVHNRVPTTQDARKGRQST